MNFILGWLNFFVLDAIGTHLYNLNLGQYIKQDSPIYFNLNGLFFSFRYKTEQRREQIFSMTCETSGLAWCLSIIV